MNRSESKFQNTASKMNRALVTLLESKEFADISIMDICEKAGVNRSTFYAHYDNTYDLLKEAFESLIANFLSECDFDNPVDLSDMRNLSKEDLNFASPKYLLPYLQYIKKHKRLYRIYAENAHAFEANKMDDYMIENIFAPIYANGEKIEMTHVFIVDETTLKYHLEYLFAGTGAKDKTSPFLSNSSINYPSTTERMLVGMIADISRIRIGDKVIFYLQATKNSQGMFFGVFKVASNPFFDENDNNNYLLPQLGKGLSFRVLLEPDTVYSKGVTEHEYLDSLTGKNHPSDLCWSLIYRKLKGNRGCTMIMDYEYEDLLNKLIAKNNNTPLTGTAFTFDSNHYEIISAQTNNVYCGRQNSLDILNRLLFKANNGNAFESHLQAYITQNIDKPILSNLLLPLPNNPAWVGNEVSCGVGMQRIDIMVKQETDTDVYIRLVELKDEAPYLNIIRYQIPWYLKWLSDYVIPKYQGKNIHLIPTVIADGNLSANLRTQYQNFTYPINNVNVQPLQYIGFNIAANQISFQRYL